MPYRRTRRFHMVLEMDTRRHKSVNRSAEEWVIRDVHTHSVEGIWSLFKRSIVGSHRMSVKPHGPLP